MASRCFAHLAAGRRELPHFQPQAKQAHRQRLAGVVHLTVRLELEVGEVLPMVDDQEILLDLTRGLVGMQPRAATNHLPELDLAEDRLGEYQVLDGRHVDTGSSMSTEIATRGMVSNLKSSSVASARSMWLSMISAIPWRCSSG